MKKFVFMLAILLTLCATTLRADNERPISVNQLPVTAQEFIKQYFAGRKVIFVKEETEFISKSYDVLFSDGDSLEFDKDGNWNEVNCKFSVVPAEIVPEPIANYVSANYPDVIIKKIEKSRREYEVKLSNRVELSFDTNFNLTDIDM